MSAKLSAETKRAVIHHVETLNKSQTATAAAFGISRASVKSILRNRVRTASEFRSMPVSPDHPRVMGGNYTWTLGEIRAARDALLRGEFKLPVKMCEAMGTNYAIATARSNRVDPSSALTAQLVAHDTARGQNICSHARKHVAVPAAVIKSAHEYLVDLGVSVLHTVHVPFSGDTGFTGFRVELWPMEFVKWDYGRECLVTQTAGGETVEIHHGDGEWTVIQSYDFKPFTKGCALAAALIWGANTYGMLDWNASARTHGLAKMIGELPADTPLVNDAGELTDQAKAFLEMMRQIVDGDSPAGIIPPGAKTQFVNNSSTAWQIFNQLIMTTDKAAARVYQGTDATLGSVGGAPGVDIATLFGVATTKIQGDLSAIERALNTGVYEPWTAINFGDSKQAPSWTYKIPDPDLERKSDEESKNEKRLTDALKERRALGLVVDQDVVNALSKKFNVFPVPQLAQSSDAKPSIALAPTDIVKVVTVNEARMSAGLGKLGGPTGDKFVSELGVTPAAPGGFTNFSKVLAGNFEEAEHPRAEDGKFGPGGGGSEGEGDSGKEPELEKELTSALKAKGSEAKAVSKQRRADSRAIFGDSESLENIHADIGLHMPRSGDDFGDLLASPVAPDISPEKAVSDALGLAEDLDGNKRAKLASVTKQAAERHNEINDWVRKSKKKFASLDGVE